MKATLIMLPQPILVSDEEIKEGDWFYHPKGVIFPATQTYMKGPVSSGVMKKVIGGYNPLPTLDLSLIAEEIGWVDVEKLAKEYCKNEDDYSIKLIAKYSYRDGFKAAQSLNEKKYSEKDLYRLLKLIGQRGYYVECDGTVYANAFDGGDVVDVVKEYSESLSKHKEYQVEYTQEGNTIKVTKIL